MKRPLKIKFFSVCEFPIKSINLVILRLAKNVLSLFKKRSMLRLVWRMHLRLFECVTTGKLVTHILVPRALVSLGQRLKRGVATGDAI